MTRNPVLTAFGVLVFACFMAWLPAHGVASEGGKGRASMAETLPQGYGLSAKYPGDDGIEKDPAGIFVEKFEERTLDGLFRRWEDVTHREMISFSNGITKDSAGRESVLMTHVGGKGTGGHLYRRLLPGYDEIFVRFYVKFDPDCFPIHHFSGVAGYHPPTRWPQGGARERPRGNDSFSIKAEPFGIGAFLRLVDGDARQSAGGEAVGKQFHR